MTGRRIVIFIFKYLPPLAKPCYYLPNTITGSVFTVQSSMFLSRVYNIHFNFDKIITDISVIILTIILYEYISNHRFMIVIFKKFQN